MDLAEGIRRIGFRRWYERQLLASHLFLVAGLLSMLVVLACIERFSLQATGWDRFVLLASIVGGGVACVYSIVRYRNMLLDAQHAADRSTCAKCATYGVLEVVRSGFDSGRGTDAVTWVRVRCRKCGNEWTIE